MDPYHYTVDVAVSPFDLQNRRIPELQDITKFENKIIGVPKNPEIEWPVFDIRNKELTFLRVEGVRRGTIYTERQGEKLYLLPGDTEGEVYCLDLNLLKVVKTYRNAFGLTGRKKFWCWGGSNCAAAILHPAWDSNRILCIKDEKIDLITVKGTFGISSVSQNNDGIWLLPVSGNFIYLANENGMILRREKLQTDGKEWDTSEFVRVVAAERQVFLLPHYYSGSILHIAEDGTVIEILTDRMQKLFEFLTPDWKNLAPYHTYAIYADRLCLFPADTSLDVINYDPLSVRNVPIRYGASLSKETYISWIKEKIKEKQIIFFESAPHDLDEFISWCLDKK